jgi:hypothetical protein
MRDIMVTVIRSWSLSIHICSEELAEQLIRVATYCAVTFLNPGSAITIIRVEAWSIRLVDIYANGTSRTHQCNTENNTKPTNISTFIQGRASRKGHL